MEELATAVNEAAFESLKYWDSSLSPEENQANFNQYKPMAKERKKATGLHGELLGLSPSLLKLIAPMATHQHYKGGLYRFVSIVVDVESHTLNVEYEHIFPHPRRFYTRPKGEWNKKFEPLA